MSDLADPRQDEVDAFWVDARMRANLNRLAAYWGPKEIDSLQPPAMAFGGSAEVADELASLVVAGVKTATAGALWDYEAAGEEVPERGQLSIVVDGSGHPRALIATTSVEVVPFDQVGEEFAAAEGEGDRSLASWRRDHEAFFRTYAAHSRGFSPDMPVVCQRFEVLFPTH